MQTSTENLAVNKIDNFAANVAESIVVNRATTVTVVKAHAGLKKRKKRVSVKAEDAVRWVELFDSGDNFVEIGEEYGIAAPVIAYNVYKYKYIDLQNKVAELETKLAACRAARQQLTEKVKLLEEAQKIKL